jgi:hypothetical protein
MWLLTILFLQVVMSIGNFNFFIGFWGLLVCLTIIGMWWLQVSRNTWLGWVWFGLFLLVHFMFWFHPYVRLPWAEYHCAEIGGKWVGYQCYVTP